MRRAIPLLCLFAAGLWGQGVTQLPPASGGSSYTLPAATSATLGGVKPDGTSILNTAGAISATPASIGAQPLIPVTTVSGSSESLAAAQSGSQRIYTNSGGALVTLAAGSAVANWWAVVGCSPSGSAAVTCVVTPASGTIQPVGQAAAAALTLNRGEWAMVAYGGSNYTALVSAWSASADGASLSTVRTANVPARVPDGGSNGVLVSFPTCEDVGGSHLNLTAAGSFACGTTTGSFPRGAMAWTAGTIANAACVSNTFSLSGASPGDYLATSYPSTLNTGVIGSMVITAINTVAITLCNLSGSSATVAAGSYGAMLLK